ncbi:MAG: flavin reductase family protein [Halobacteriales archaeon]|nr:flavin reductase family protein [Halobacteriales archaeon]
MEADAEAHADSMYRTLTSLVVPRPIGWISTLGADGRDNLAPFSYFNAVSSQPPVVLFSAGRRDGEPKDSARFALETGEFVANLVTQDVIGAMDATAAGVSGSEFDAAGVERADSRVVEPPRVAAAHACLECEVRESVDVGGHTVVFGDVRHVYVDDDLLVDGKVEARAVDAVGRLGGSLYTGVEPLEYTRQH